METTIYDVHGKPQIYIDHSDDSIYTWNGHAVAYLDGEDLYGWHGQHLGWFVDGIIYDCTGYRVGFTSQQCPVTPKVEPVKYAKHTQYSKYTQKASPSPPAFKQSNSSQDLEQFIRQNAP